MEKKNFSDIGKVEAIRQLFEVSPFKQKDGTAFLSGEKGGIVRTASRLWLEGIDFDLTYFPLKHLGYKCVVGTVGELYASLARPQSISVRLGISAKLDLPHPLHINKGELQKCRRSITGGKPGCKSEQRTGHRSQWRKIQDDLRTGRHFPDGCNR